MRINKYIAQATGLSRRSADEALRQNRVTVNGELANIGDDINEADTILLDGELITASRTKTIIFHKPCGYVCSRDGQGNKTIYDILPSELHELKPVGRLDKNTSGLLLMTNDGDLAHQLTHPSFHKKKTYDVTLDTSLTPHILDDLAKGVELEDGLSKFDETILKSDSQLRVTLHEGRNRQIRRTFEKLGRRVKDLHRITFGDYELGDIKSGHWKIQN